MTKRKPNFAEAEVYLICVSVTTDRPTVGLDDTMVDDLCGSSWEPGAIVVARTQHRAGY